MQLSNLTSKDKKVITLLIGSVLMFVLISWIISARWIIAISGSDSMPQHVMIVDKSNKNVKKGDIVGFYYPGKPMHEYKKGDKFIKYLICDEGDTLKVENRKYYCNDKFIGEAITINSYGEPVDSFIYNGKIPKGKFFTWTPFHYSYDSRYWGFANKKDIIGKGWGIL